MKILYIAPENTVDTLNLWKKSHEKRGNECIFIDDVSDNIRAAEEVGMHGILFVSVQDLLKKLQNYISL